LVVDPKKVKNVFDVYGQTLFLDKMNKGNHKMIGKKRSRVRKKIAHSKFKKVKKSDDDDDNIIRDDSEVDGYNDINKIKSKHNISTVEDNHNGNDNEVKHPKGSILNFISKLDKFKSKKYKKSDLIEYFKKCWYLMHSDYSKKFAKMETKFFSCIKKEKKIPSQNNNHLTKKQLKKQITKEEKEELYVKIHDLSLKQIEELVKIIKINWHADSGKPLNLPVDTLKGATFHNALAYVNTCINTNRSNPNHKNFAQEINERNALKKSTDMISMPLIHNNIQNCYNKLPLLDDSMSSSLSDSDDDSSKLIFYINNVDNSK
jgi:hypothetical protein